MKVGKKARIVLDVMLTLMIVFEMFIQYTGNFLHEVIGFVFFATIAIHLVFSAAWMKSTAKLAKKGRLGGQRIALVVMGCLLAITIIVLGVSSVAISGLLYSAGFIWTLGSYDLWKTVHTVSSYLLCALVVVHLGMHWAFLASAFKIPYNPARRQAISTGVHAVAAVGAIALGVTAANQVMSQALASTGTTEETAGASSSAKSFERSISDKKVPSGKRGKSLESTPGSSEGAGDASSDASSAEPSNDASTVSGICTLCRKQCPLSAPKCDKPYRAGLL